MVFVGCVAALTTALAVAQWQWEGRVNVPLVSMIGAICGTTAYVVSGIIRLMLPTINRFTRWRRSAAAAQAEPTPSQPDREPPDFKNAELSATS
jgi:hypothetical protein